MNEAKIHQVETQISNKIISEYEKEKDKSKVARFKYLKKKAEKKFVEIKKREEELKHQAESNQRKQENIKVANRYRTVLRGLENNFTILKNSEEHEQLERFYNPKKRGLPVPLDIPTESSKYNLFILIVTAEAFRNKTIYEYFKDCPGKPRYT